VVGFNPDDMRAPLPQSYWVTERLAAGAYPTGPLEGVDTYVDLTHEADGARRYAERLPLGARRLSFPVRDYSVPREEVLVAILDAIDGELTGGRTTYVHCLGGLGRTGLVVGCWLVRHGCTGDEALARVAELVRLTPGGHVTSPETPAQRETVRRWPPPGTRAAVDET
jgi:protein-tyrosine phosphatase